MVGAILGLWSTAQGDIRIDGTESKYYDGIELGPQIGYLPQDIELFDGSIADNIARFGAQDPDMVIQAAQDAGVHQMILALPEGYDTIISGLQGLLSLQAAPKSCFGTSSVRQASLASALDEPNSNLDELGEQALNTAIANMKRRALPSL